MMNDRGADLAIAIILAAFVGVLFVAATEGYKAGKRAAPIALCAIDETDGDPALVDNGEVLRVYLGNEIWSVGEYVPCKQLTRHANT
jgi:hypothetical protein